MRKFILLIGMAIYLPLSVISQCSVGGNGIASATNQIIIDGDMEDWNLLLSDPDNNTYDPSPDLDAPIADAGRDFWRFTFTEDLQNLSLYFQREGSSNNAIDLVYYLDVNNDNQMTLNEPVVVINWSGSNGNASARIYNYIPAESNNTMTGDGENMPGSLQPRTTSIATGKGAADGKSMEIKIAFSYLFTPGSEDPANQLAYGKPFKFHISAINGSVASVPGANSINDNFGGCFSGEIAAVVPLPLTLLEFSGSAEQGKAKLKWTVGDNETGDYFKLEKSADGINFREAATIFTSDAIGQAQYNFSEQLKEQVTYYRLQMINKNASRSYSKIIMLRNNHSSSANSLVLLSNPITSHLSFTYKTNSTGLHYIHIYNQAGIKVWSTQRSFYAGENAVSLPLDQKINAGFYILEVVNENERASTKLIKK